jgi:site-specific recombinase XerD
MVHNLHNISRFPQPHAQRLFHTVEEPSVVFPIQSVHIDRERLVAKRPTVLEAVDTMPVYLVKPEVMLLLDADKHPMARQTVNRHIAALLERIGGSPFPISAHTFRHSFAIHLSLHGRPVKYVSKLLGLKSVDSTEIYTNVLTVDGAHFLKGVDFH